MAAAPRWKVYDHAGKYRAAFHYADDAASFVAVLGDGATVRLGHAKRDTVWTEGAEEFSAGESYDATADVIERRASASHPHYAV